MHSYNSDISCSRKVEIHSTCNIVNKQWQRIRVNCVNLQPCSTDELNQVRVIHCKKMSYVVFVDVKVWLSRSSGLIA